MSSRLAILALGYVVLTGLFVTASIHSRPEAPAVAMSAVSIGKTNRLNIGSPDTFVTERFAS